MPNPRSEVVALLRACKELPEEDVHRLVLSDWLEENSADEHELGLRDLIRVQVEHDSLPRDDPRRRTLASESGRLQDRHGDVWLGNLDTDRVNWGLKHGLFVMTVHAADLARRELGAPGLTERWEWVERLTLLGTSEDDYKAAFTAEPLGHIGTLDLRRNTLNEGSALALADSPQLSNLCGLVLSKTNITRRGFHAILESPHLRSLHRLELDSNALEAKEMEALADWPALPNLNRLSLAHNPIKAEGIELLFAGRAFPRLRELNLRSTAIHSQAMRHLASSDMPRLRELDLAENRLLDSDDLRELLGAKWLVRVERLSLGRTLLNNRGIAALAGCSNLPALTRLELNDLEVNQSALAALMGSKHLAGLRTLDLRSAHLSPNYYDSQRRRSALERALRGHARPHLTVLY